MQYNSNTCSGTPAQTITITDFDLDGTVDGHPPYQFCVDHTGDDVFGDSVGTWAWVLSEHEDLATAVTGPCATDVSLCSSYLIPGCIFPALPAIYTNTEYNAIFAALSPSPYIDLAHYYCAL